MKLLIFNFSETNLPVRSCTIDGQPWFVAADVCRNLGLKNPTRAVAALEPDEVCQGNLDGLTLSKGKSIDCEGSKRVQPHSNLVNESGLYALIFKSRKPVARRFRLWVTGEVLPAIRERGFYSVFGSDSDAAKARLEGRVASQMSHIRSSVEALREPLPEGYASISSHLRSMGVDLSDDAAARMRVYSAVRALAREKKVRVIPVWSANSWRAVSHYPRELVRGAISALHGVELEPDLFDAQN